ncbi:MAG: hypothetical protein VB070_14315 [Clostridiaceae bacterium]|nr:hypothetical protein [Clostridiaceae bacterium]
MTRQEIRIALISLLLFLGCYVLLMNAPWFAVFRATGSLLPVVRVVPLSGNEQIILYETEVLPLQSVRVRQGLLGIKLLTQTDTSSRKALTYKQGDQILQIYYQASLAIRRNETSDKQEYHKILTLGFNSEKPLRSVCVRNGEQQIEAAFIIEQGTRHDYIFYLPVGYRDQNDDFTLADTDLAIS